jgi:hypothetical protein
MRINNFIPYSKKTPSVINLAKAPQSRELELAVQRQTAVVHQIIGNNTIKCTSSQLETVKTPALPMYLWHTNTRLVLEKMARTPF